MKLIIEIPEKTYLDAKEFCNLSRLNGVYWNPAFGLYHAVANGIPVKEKSDANTSMLRAAVCFALLYCAFGTLVLFTVGHLTMTNFLVMVVFVILGVCCGYCAAKLDANSREKEGAHDKSI